MRLTRVRIEQLRQYRRPVVIEDLEPGLNLFTGPNGAGKTTLVDAIRAAFFERHRSGTVDHLRPWDEPTATPTVELEFEIAGTRHHLTKCFLGRKRCVLAVGTTTLDGDDAEERLAELLGFEHPGRGESKPTHWGIPGLLWVQQGSGQEIYGPVGHAAARLQAALQCTLGEVASTDGDAVIARVRTEREMLLTPARQQPTGAYAEAIRHFEDLDARLRELDGRIDTYRTHVDQLAAKQAEHDRLEADQPWATLRAAADGARRKLEQVQGLQDRLDEQRARVRSTSDLMELRSQQLAGFEHEAQRLAEMQRTLEAASDALSGAHAVLAPLDMAVQAAQQADEAARSELARARQHDQRLRRQRELEDAKARIDDLRRVLDDSRQAEQQLRELRQQAGTAALPPHALIGLRRQATAVREAELRLASVATRLRFSLTADARIELDGESLTGDGERHLHEHTRVVLPGLGTIDITPGGDDVASLARERAQAQQAWDALIQELRVTSLEDAEARERAHGELLQQARIVESTLRALAPNGPDAVATELAVHEGRAQEAGQALQALPAAGQCAHSEADAQRLAESAASALEQAREERRHGQARLFRAETAHEAARREFNALEMLLAQPDRAERIGAARQALLEATATNERARNEVDALESQLRTANADALRNDVERLSRSAEQERARYHRLREELSELQGSVRRAGADGLEEARAGLGLEHEQARRRVEELKRRADALDYLLELLVTRRQALTRRLQAPLQRHIDRYMTLMFPQTGLQITDALTPGALLRQGSVQNAGDFAAQSYGTREQLGLICRLAYADMLREAGRPTLLILDDALVHSDDCRMDGMKRVLFDAAQRHQILLLSCHPERWRDLGVQARDVAALMDAC